MNIVIVCDFGEVNGGAAKVAVLSARGLAEAGFNVTFVCAIAPVSALLEHPRIAVRCLGFENVWVRRNPLAAAIQGIWNGRARRALESILASLPRDETVVHFHQWTKALSPSVLVAPLRYGLPSVVSLHDYFVVCPNGAYYRFPERVPCRLVPMSPACIVAQCDRRGYAHKLVRVLRQWATRAALARCGATLSLMSVSPFAERAIGRFLPRGHARFVLRSPIETLREPPVRVADNRDFVFVGRLSEEKGVQLLAETTRAAGFPLIVVGDGPLFGALRDGGGTVRCTGWLDAAGIAEVLKRARALVFPSTWYETGGLVVLEALARGIPTIVSHVTAPVDFVADGVNGYVVEPHDGAALLARMRSLMDDSVAARMGEEAYRRYWTDPQTIEAHTGNLVSAYRNVLAAARPGAAGAVGHQAA
jgi:glycosyltransferase involved in cell wall biosynthesis